jgi:hypothetical protein
MSTTPAVPPLPDPLDPDRPFPGQGRPEDDPDLTPTPDPEIDPDEDPDEQLPHS